MYTQEQITKILQLIEDEKERLGSFAAVAKKCKISETALSQVRSGKYGASGADIYDTIALALGYDFDNGEWQMAETKNYIDIMTVLGAAKKKSLFLGISEKSGCGKTSTSRAFLEKNKKKGAFMLTCRAWTGREFLSKLAVEVGAELPKGYVSVSEMIDAISISIKKKAHIKPLVIIDQANSLKPSALTTLIHIYNDCEDIMGCVMLGTKNLEYKIKKGVRYSVDGFDEIDSRFTGSRDYIYLDGATIADIRAICAVNGIKDTDKQRAIFEECNPVRKELSDGKTIRVVKDLRSVKRIVQREKMLSHEQH